MTQPIENPLLSDLNDEQRDAVLHEGGPLLILAGAGSGKTRVITRRLAYLILERRVDPLRIVAITFTNKAAREMKDRVQQFVPRTDLWISTFHSMATRILRREAAAIGYKSDFTIYDTYDRAQALRGVIRDLSLDDELYKPGSIAHQISARKNRGLKPGDPDPLLDYIDPVFARIEKAYAERMQQNQALDFDDLLLKLMEVFETRPEIAERYANKFEHVLVDEYQDTNRLQYKITNALAKIHNNLCICGDPDQSIYAWRGADIRNILDFERDYAPVKVVRLETNYRSKRNILTAAQGVIEHNTQRKAKLLKSFAPEGEKIEVLECENELDEARMVVSRIRELFGKSVYINKTGGVARLGDMAIFYRANFLQRALEKVLRETGTPYRIASGVEFFERREIKDIIAYLRLLVNPNDDVAFERVVNVPGRGFGDASLQKLRDEASRRMTPLLVAAQNSSVRALLPSRPRRSLEAFVQLLESLQQKVDGGAEAALEAIIRATQYEQYCGDLGESGDADRVENIRELVVAGREFDTRNSEGGVRGFLSEVALVSDTDKLDNKTDYVTLMTLHSAKGLEFPIVFIVGVEEGLIPHRRSIDEAGGVEEERRLFYVGITRSMERLFLSRARHRSQFGANGPLYIETDHSRFLDEIPREVLNWRETHNSKLHSNFDRYEYENTTDFAHDASQVAPELPEAPPANSSLQKFKAGARVRHAQFGEGRVVELRGSGVNTRAVVHFRGAGEKQLLLQYARLELV
ncbi:MAG: ATP-dependent helicase [Planctomycetota bacterium]